MNSPGFTLVELAVVLGIIAILTHLAVREAGQWRAAQLHTLADRGLAEIKEAVLGDDFERDAEGVRTRTGFLADMGRLPQAATNAQGRLTLAELWTPPAPNTPYAARPATAANLTSGSDLADADEDVLVPCGWRGPYLRLPFGKTRLLDAWGNAYETPDDAHTTARLRTADDVALPSAGTPIVVVRHLGADGAPDTLTAPARPEDADTTLNLFEDHGAAGLTNCSLTVTVNAYDSDGNPATGSYSGTVRVYSPYGAQITVVKAPFTLAAGTAHATVTGLTPGSRVLRVACNGRKGLPRPLIVHPGANAAIDRLKID